MPNEVYQIAAEPNHAVEDCIEPAFDTAPKEMHGTGGFVHRCVNG